MSQLRLLLFILLLIATATQRFAGLLLGLTVLAINELVHLLLQLQGPARVRRRPLSSWLNRLPPVFRRRRGAVRDARFPTYDRIAADLGWARFSRRDFDFGLRERLLQAATVRLADGHGIDLTRNPEAARPLLGEEAWRLLAPGQLPSTDRTAPGLSLPELDRLVTSLERLRSPASRTDHTPAGPESGGAERTS